MLGYEEAKAAGEAEPLLTLLTDITGSFRPGVLTALMGVSGAGKVRWGALTALMGVLGDHLTSAYRVAFTLLCHFANSPFVGSHVRPPLWMSLLDARPSVQPLVRFLDETPFLGNGDG